jgi:ribokinase
VSARIAVLGSANMDLVVSVPRAPGRGETVSGTAFRTLPGGKGANQALAAQRAGGQVCFLGAVGDDGHGAQIRELLAADGIDVSGLATVDEPTGTAHIDDDDAGENSIVVVPGANATLQSMSAHHRETIAAAEVLLLQLELPLGIVVEAAAFARAQGVRAILTPAPAIPLPAGLFADIDLLVPNQHEAAILAGTSEPDAAGRALNTRGCDVLVTLGAAGSRYYTSDSDTALALPAFTVPAVDTTAAGDSFVGAFAVASAEGGDVRSAVRFASAAAALTVGRVGASASIPWRTDIDRFLTDHPEQSAC